MSTTPRTDAIVAEFSDPDDAMVSPDFARTLELENIALREGLANMTEKNDWNVKQVKLLHEGLHKANQECCVIVKKFKDEKASLQSRLLELEAQAAGMRKAVEFTQGYFIHGFPSSNVIQEALAKALIPTAGSALLEELREARERVKTLEEGALWALAQAYAYKESVCSEDKDYAEDLKEAHRKIDPQTFASAYPTPSSPGREG